MPQDPAAITLHQKSQLLLDQFRRKKQQKAKKTPPTEPQNSKHHSHQTSVISNDSIKSNLLDKKHIGPPSDLMQNKLRIRDVEIKHLKKNLELAQ